MRMMRSKVEVAVEIPRSGYREEIWPGKDVDFDRVIAKDVAAQAERGKAGADDYQPAVAAQPAITVADALGDYTKYFEPTPAEPAKASSKAVKE